VLRALDEHPHPSHKKDFFDFPAFGPLKRYKGIVDRDADDLINAQFNKFVVTPLIARQVTLRARQRNPNVLFSVELPYCHPSRSGGGIIAASLSCTSCRSITVAPII
jgi:hypothetical protein